MDFCASSAVIEAAARTESEIVFDQINSVMNGNYHGIGIHSLRASKSSDNAVQILKQGLKIDFYFLAIYRKWLRNK